VRAIPLGVSPIVVAVFLLKLTLPECCIHSAHVVPGDIVILDLGKRISADVRLIETQDLQCGEMALTGMRLIRAALSTRREPYRV